MKNYYVLDVEASTECVQSDLETLHRALSETLSKKCFEKEFQKDLTVVANVSLTEIEDELKLEYALLTQILGNVSEILKDYEAIKKASNVDSDQTDTLPALND